jgi:hypothetical protein
MDSKGMLAACIILIVISLIIPAAGLLGETTARTLSSASLAAGMLAAFMVVKKDRNRE